MFDSVIRGRPTKYTPELAERICQAIATHGCGARKLSKMYDWFPNVETVNEWRNKYSDFSDMYLNSRFKQTHAMFESAIDEVESIEDCYSQDSVSGALKVDSGIVAAKKAIANQKTHQAARLNPRMYAVSKEPQENNTDETLRKLSAMVAEFNKTNVSDV